MPPLNAIRAFEAAARHLSITVAADELNVTPGAVSRQIRSLGIQLLHHGHRQISLTGPGDDYYRAITKAMDALRDETLRPRAPDPYESLSRRCSICPLPAV